LHRELVDIYRYEAKVCKHCRTEISKGKLPEYSIANGYNFANATRLNLPELNDIEKALISPYRRYSKLYKVRASPVSEFVAYLQARRSQEHGTVNATERAYRPRLSH
jgi:hypothetical protein